MPPALDEVHLQPTVNATSLKSSLKPRVQAYASVVPSYELLPVELAS